MALYKCLMTFNRLKSRDKTGALCLIFETSNSKSEVSKSNSQRKNYFFLKNYVTSEGAVSHNVIYY